MERPEEGYDKIAGTIDRDQTTPSLAYNSLIITDITAELQLNRLALFCTPVALMRHGWGINIANLLL